MQVSEVQLFQIKKDVLATKEDISRLEILLEKSAKENLKWMVIFFIPLYLTLLGFILANIDRLF